MLLSGWDNRLPLAVVSLAGRHRLWGSVAAAHGLGVNSCGSRTLEHRLGSCGMLAQLLCSIWDLPGSGIEPVSPALAGRFFTTEPPGKPCLCFILLKKKFFFLAARVFIALHQFSPEAVSGGDCRVVVCRLLVAEHGLWSSISVVVAHRLSSSMACGTSPDQGSSLCPLHWQADS